MIPFLPPHHPWYGRRFTLKDWFQGRTETTKVFDVVILGSVMVLLTALAGLAR